MRSHPDLGSPCLPEETHEDIRQDSGLILPGEMVRTRDKMLLVFSPWHQFLQQGILSCPEGVLVVTPNGYERFFKFAQRITFVIQIRTASAKTIPISWPLFFVLQRSVPAR